ncbi:MAG TPA: Yip1 family protein [Steroidobacteraceae bacterium]
MNKLIGRAQRILLTPGAEWPAIAAEADTTAGIYRNYIAILAALGPVAMFLKTTLIGYQMPFLGSYRVDFFDGLIAMLVSYGLSLVAVYVFALIINALAPSFGSQKDSLLALKTAAYAMTAAWIAGIGQLLPFLGSLILLAGAGYSVYLLYLALPVTMKTPADKTVAYTAVSVVSALLLFWLVAVIAGSILGRGPWMGGHGGWFGGPVASQRGEFDKDSPLGKLEQWGEEVEAAGKRAEESAKQPGGVPSSAAIGELMGTVTGAGKPGDALPIEQIKSFLPETLAGLPRTDLSAERNAALGFEVSEANATYSDGAERTLRLKVNDTGGAKGLLALANWAGVEQEREWSGGYERDHLVDGNMVHERWDAASGIGEYGLIVGRRFSVEISGNAAGMEELKAALGAGVDIARLEALAKD